MTQRITAAYSDLVTVAQTIRDLLNNGFQEDNICLIFGESLSIPKLSLDTLASEEDGEFSITIEVPGTQLDKVLKILQRHHPYQVEGPNFHWKLSSP